MENKIRHLEMIQKVIERMSTNSYMLKGLSVTLLMGLFTLASKDNGWVIFAISLLPIVVFWGLDSYYLLQERLFRALYDQVRKQNEEDVDFSMNTKCGLKEKNCKWVQCVISKTELFFYLPLAILSSGVIFIMIK